MSLSPYGLVQLPVWGYCLVTFLTIESMFLGVTLYLHRDQSHGGLILHPALRHVVPVLAVVQLRRGDARWVAVHRCHHAHADQPGDPHSPVLFGLRRVLFEGLRAVSRRDPRPAAAAQLRARHARRLAGTAPLQRASLHSAWCCSCSRTCCCLAWPAIIMIAVHLAAQPFFAGGVINGLGHAVGYRSFEMPSTATNLLPWALLLGGEELHNNHHAFPRSARFAVQRWELDVGWLWIRLFRALGLAKVRWVAPRPQSRAPRPRARCRYA